MLDPSPSSRKLTPRKTQQRERILEAACHLMADHGYEGTTMRAIAACSGTAEKTLYNIYGTKDRLIATAARQRSAGLFITATDAAPEGGWPMLRAFARTTAQLTLADPPMARALAAVLLDHAELVGLDALYAGPLADALDQMAQKGMLDSGWPRAAIIRLIRLGVIAAVIFWAKGEISDEELEPYIVSRIVETLLPSLIPGQEAPLLDQLRGARQVLSPVAADDGIDL